MEEARQGDALCMRTPGKLCKVNCKKEILLPRCQEGPGELVQQLLLPRALGWVCFWLSLKDFSFSVPSVISIAFSLPLSPPPGLDVCPLPPTHCGCKGALAQGWRAATALTDTVGSVQGILGKIEEKKKNERREKKKEAK